MTDSRDIVTSLADAARLIPDGCRLTLGGQSVYQRPMALARELVRQRRRDLTIVGVLNGPETDLLVGAGCVAMVETSYVGLEQFGLARNFRRAVEQRRIEVEDYSEMVAFDRFRATEDGLTFLATPALFGSDVLAENPKLKPFSCPLTGRPYIAVPPADPDVVVVHAAAADNYGNVLAPMTRMMPQSFDEVIARTALTVIVTCERLIDNDFVRRHSAQTVIAGFKVDAVVEVPWGGHPGHSLGHYTIDVAHFADYVHASADDESFARYLQEWVDDLDHPAYLERLGGLRMTELATATGLG